MEIGIHVNFYRGTNLLGVVYTAMTKAAFYGKSILPDD
ncbi:hypothetical protein S1OALGB6SA_2078 [Olavius algarvensis spirochete endosymbiont]|nr:hypothetical protein S1OALGB6SA_2078 [Olavius algarvensis spirochete endosymbiont]